MRISDALVQKLLKDSGKFSKKQLAGLHEQEQTERKPLQDLVINSKLLDETELTKLYASEINIPFINFDPKKIDLSILSYLPEPAARRNKAVIFDLENDTMLLAMEDPEDVEAIKFLKKQLGSNVKLHISPTSRIQAALERYNLMSDFKRTELVDSADREIADSQIDPSEWGEDSAVAQTINVLIEDGIRSNASDIHIEPRTDVVVVRYRIDGLLREVNKLPYELLDAIVGRTKLISNLSVNERLSPQEGNLKIETGGHVYSLRVSTLPIVDGEKIAMHILKQSAKPADPTALGLWGRALNDLQQGIIQPSGIIVVSGPASSGKSTTLFSLINLLQAPGVNVSTIEDPVKFRIPGANQIEVNPLSGITFTSVLDNFMRHDPNVIMVGEINDYAIADLSLKAARNGHFVLSSLHTNNAATAVSQLLSMSLDPFILSTNLKIVVGQRLVRKLCLDCRKSFKPDTQMQKKLIKTFNLPVYGGVKAIHDLEKQALQAGLGDDAAASELGSTEKAITKLWSANKEGCSNCNHTGYKGRIGIFEVLPISPTIQRAIIEGNKPEIINTLGINEGMLNMQLDGFIKALRGLTTSEEVLRTAPYLI